MLGEEANCPLPISASSLPSTLPLQLQQLLDPTTPSLSPCPPPHTGSVGRTQEVIDFCAKHEIQPTIQVFPVEELNSVYEKLDQCNDTGLRYVMDIEGTLNEKAKEACRNKPAPVLSPPTGAISVGNIFTELCRLVCCCRCC